MIQHISINYARAAKMLFPMLLSTLLLFLFGSCTDEQLNNPTLNGEEKQITLSLMAPKSFTPATYSTPAKIDEDKIQTVDVLIFSPKDGSSDFEYFSGPHFGSLGDVGSGPMDVRVNIPLKVPDGSMVAIFANSRKIINDLSFVGENDVKDTKKVALEKIVLDDKALSSQWETFTESGVADPKTFNLIPMHGEVAIADIDGDPVSLVRMVANINVTVSEVALSDFTLNKVYLYKRNTKGYVAPIGPFSSVVDDDVVEYDVTGTNTCQNLIYTFEAEAGDGSDFADNTCIVIGGKYGPYPGVEAYYRVDFFGKKDTDEGDPAYLALLRNHRYNVSVSKIFGPGYDDPDKAAASKPINMEYTIEKWDESTIVDGGYNGQYMIGVSAAKFSFDAAARNTTTGDNVLIIKTNHPDGWSWKASDGSGDLDPSTGWLKLTTMAGADITAPVKDASGLTTSEVRLSLTANTEGASPQLRSGVIKLTAGNVTYDVSVTQSNTMNDDNLFPSEAADYEMRPYGRRLFIPVSAANAGSSTIKINSGDVFEVDFSPLTTNPITDNNSPIKVVKPVGTGSTGHIYVESGDGLGTATVRLIKGGTPIHSWTVEVKPEPKANSYIVSPNSSILIPVSQIADFETALRSLPNNDGTTFIADDDTKASNWFDDAAAFGTTMVWQDRPLTNMIVLTTPIGTGIDGYVKVSVGGNVTAGNAVVAVTQAGNDSSGDIIRWSWHIWVTSEEPQPSGTTPAGLRFMDRNLGAYAKTGASASNVAFGLTYQWGRKDPFPVANVTSTNTVTESTIYYGIAALNSSRGNSIGKIPITSMSGDYTPNPRFNATNANNVDYSVANPHIFYHRGTNAILYDWYILRTVFDGASRQRQNNNLWGGFWVNAQDKTVFDPCPSGWRVPKTSALSSTANILEASDPAYSWEESTSPWNGINKTLTFASTDYGLAGVTFANHGGFYPAAGYRSNNNGDLDSVGSLGYCWSASPYTTNDHPAGSLNIKSGSTNPVVSTSRAASFTLRCVQD